MEVSLIVHSRELVGSGVTHLRDDHQLRAEGGEPEDAPPGEHPGPTSAKGMKFWSTAELQLNDDHQQTFTARCL